MSDLTDLVRQYSRPALYDAVLSAHDMVRRSTSTLADAAMAPMAIVRAKLSRPEYEYGFPQNFVNSFLERQIKIPSFVNSTILDIVNKQTEISQRWNMFPQFASKPMHLHELTSLSWLSNNILKKLIREDLRLENWDGLEEIEEVIDNAVAIQETALTSETYSVEDIKRGIEELQLQVNKIASKVLKKDFKAEISFWITIFGLLLTLYQSATSADNTSNPDAATKTDIEQLRRDLYKAIDTTAALNGRVGVVIQPSSVHVKPRTKNYTVSGLSVGTTITILQTHHKWAFITYTDKDSLPQSGWILKKHLWR